MLFDFVRIYVLAGSHYYDVFGAPGDE
ncbi:MAG: hypothetical protein ACD_47C00617G0002, partial [uncultured bacterium]